MLELEQDHGDFENTFKDIKKRFKFLGDAGTFHFLWVVAEGVPDYEEWCKAHH